VRSAIARGLEPPKYKPRPPRSRIADPFEPYLKERLAAYPGLTAVRLWREAKERVRGCRNSHGGIRFPLEIESSGRTAHGRACPAYGILSSDLAFFFLP
jgi:hypothetical protein